MNRRHSLVPIYATRLARREWRRFLLPFLSLMVTAVVLTLTLLLTSASGSLLNEQARELLGGDVVIESTSAVWPEEALAIFSAPPTTISTQMSFTATVESQANALAVSMQVVDEFFPVYGEAKTSEGKYRYPNQTEIILDQASAEQLAVGVGDSVRFGNTPYTVGAILVTEPTSLIAGFRFLPRVILSTEGFLASGVDPALLRPEYEYAVAVNELTASDKDRLQTWATASAGQFQIKIADENQGNLQINLTLVRDFLIVAVLITAILATVNVYASTVYLITVEQKSFAIMLSLGLTSRRLIAVLGWALAYVVIFASVFGVMVGQGLFWLTRLLVEKQFAIALPTPDYVSVAVFTASFLSIIALSAFVPTLQHLLAMRPKQILAGTAGVSGVDIKLLTIITGVTLLPLLLASSWLLGSVWQGVVTVLGVGLVYVLVASLFSLLLAILYKARTVFPFWLRSIIAHKRADGLFGIISFTSLFIALTALSTLVLLQVSLERYLKNDLSQTVPTTYVLDVQPSQRDELLAQFPEIVLFSNTPARLIAIDDLQIQEELSANTGRVDRELGREFNVTARSELLDSEKITVGEDWVGRPGEISVDADFAKRAGIKLGSTVVFSVQGFLITGKVTSFRETDSRSGLPFFYFVLSPADLADFPVVYFGYTYQVDEQQTALSRYVASNLPNVTILKTQTLAPLILQITSLLLLIILVVAIPPLLIAVLLIVTLIISSYSARRLEAGRLRALGATTNQVLIQYLIETCVLALSAGVLAYLLGVLVAHGIAQYLFEISSLVLFDGGLVTSLGAIVLLVVGLGVYLFKTDRMKLRELLSYGEY